MVNDPLLPYSLPDRVIHAQALRPVRRMASLSVQHTWQEHSLRDPAPPLCSPAHVGELCTWPACDGTMWTKLPSNHALKIHGSWEKPCVLIPRNRNAITFWIIPSESHVRGRKKLYSPTFLPGTLHLFWRKCFHKAYLGLGCLQSSVLKTFLEVLSITHRESGGENVHN